MTMSISVLKRKVAALRDKDGVSTPDWNAAIAQVMDILVKAEERDRRLRPPRRRAARRFERHPV